MAKVASASGEQTKDAIKSFSERKTEWKSMWISIGMQFVVGVQISIYYMSMWPYLSGIDTTATLDFLGWVMAACNIGCTISNPIYGYWNQRFLSAKWPTVTGFVIAAAGQVIYAYTSSVKSDAKWWLLGARIVTGLGVGNLAALRAYGAMASVPADRLKAIAFGTAGYVSGISFGPVIAAVFTPLGEKGFMLGSLQVNMYTASSYLMVILCLAAAVFVIFFFHEDYAGLLNEDDHDENAYVVIPKFDLLPALVCIYLYMIVNMIATNIGVLSTPLSTALYDWKDSQSILYNGIMECSSCIVSVTGNFLIGFTRLGKIDKRWQVLFGLTIFMCYQLVNYPWPFYPGPLDPIPPGMNTTVIGGCDYDWCSTSRRVPLPVYITSFVVFFGIAFPFVESPAATMYSEILGPRRQGTMQGLFSLGGSLSPFVASVLSTFLFQHTGYKYVIIMQAASLAIAYLLVFLFYPRLTALKLKPPPGKAAVYDKGVFYSM